MDLSRKYCDQLIASAAVSPWLAKRALQLNRPADPSWAGFGGGEPMPGLRFTGSAAVKRLLGAATAAGGDSGLATLPDGEQPHILIGQGGFGKLYAGKGSITFEDSSTYYNEDMDWPGYVAVKIFQGGKPPPSPPGSSADPSDGKGPDDGGLDGEQPGSPGADGGQPGAGTSAAARADQQGPYPGEDDFYYELKYHGVRARGMVPTIAAALGLVFKDGEGDVRLFNAILYPYEGPTTLSNLLRGDALGGAGCIGAAYSVTKTVHDLLTKFGTALVHMDIKPENIAPRADGQFRLLDKGCLVTLEEALSKTWAGGTIGYASLGDPTEFTDIWAICRLLFVMVYGIQIDQPVTQEEARRLLSSGLLRAAWGDQIAATKSCPTFRCTPWMHEKVVPLLRNRSLSSGELEVHRRWRAADMLVVAVMMWLACAFTVPDIADRPPPNFFLEALHKLYNQHSLEAMRGEVGAAQGARQLLNTIFNYDFGGCTPLVMLDEAIALYVCDLAATKGVMPLHESRHECFNSEAFQIKWAEAQARWPEDGGWQSAFLVKWWVQHSGSPLLQARVVTAEDDQDPAVLLSSTQPAEEAAAQPAAASRAAMQAAAADGAAAQAAAAGGAAAQPAAADGAAAQPADEEEHVSARTLSTALGSMRTRGCGKSRPIKDSIAACIPLDRSASYITLGREAGFVQHLGYTPDTIKQLQNLKFRSIKTGAAAPLPSQMDAATADVKAQEHLYPLLQRNRPEIQGVLTGGIGAVLEGLVPVMANPDAPRNVLPVHNYFNTTTGKQERKMVLAPIIQPPRSTGAAAASTSSAGGHAAVAVAMGAAAAKDAPAAAKDAPAAAMEDLQAAAQAAPAAAAGAATGPRDGSGVAVFMQPASGAGASTSYAAAAPGANAAAVVPSAPPAGVPAANTRSRAKAAAASAATAAAAAAAAASGTASAMAPPAADVPAPTAHAAARLQGSDDVTDRCQEKGATRGRAQAAPRSKAAAAGTVPAPPVSADAATTADADAAVAAGNFPVQHDQAQPQSLMPTLPLVWSDSLPAVEIIIPEDASLQDMAQGMHTKKIKYKAARGLWMLTAEEAAWLADPCHWLYLPTSGEQLIPVYVRDDEGVQRANPEVVRWAATSDAATDAAAEQLPQ